MNMANGMGQFMPADAGLKMVASIHAGNTSPRNLLSDMWAPAEPPTEPIPAFLL